MQILIIGCGRVGAGLAHDLSQRGHAVYIVDQDPAAFARLRGHTHVQTITGLSFDHDVLRQAGIGHADSLAAVTGSDTTNVVMARLARLVFHVPRVVARLYDPRYTEIYRRLGIQTINPLTWGVQRLAELLCYSNLHTVLSVGSGDVDLLEIELPPLLVGRTVHEMTLPGEMQVTALSRDGRTFLPTLGTVFQEGDRLHLAVLVTSTARLNALLG
ncbi:MAG: TrkA family potassium uptake protein [Candidatus Tectomicrobia bacterium]|uniref:Trk system potassium uptake protein TrkA n=1 Tax=Tectimicrobiota bacterium TaxID=2528274 RepID=A0A937W0N5_UNCTE|nr:TrkA family potassium uptake protein [Candidatus Tectomicrobia bacterium]